MARSAGSLVQWRRNAVKQMVACREATLAFVARLPEADVLRPRTQDEWSVKDVLAHLMTCDEETVRRLKLIAQGRGDRIYWFMSLADADRFNAKSIAATRRLGLRAVLRRMARVRADLIRRFERLPIESLADPSHAYTLVSWFPVSGWTHEREHVGEIKAWWRSRPR